MKSLHKLIMAEIKRLREEFPKDAVDAFAIEASIHIDREDNFDGGWYGVRTPSNIGGATLYDMNFCFKNNKPGDDGPYWAITDQGWYSMRKCTSGDEWEYTYLDHGK